MSGLDYYVIGRREDFGVHTFSAEEIVEFARKYDPQPFHLDEEAARNSMFGGLCASGWHTTAIWMRKACDFRDREFARIEAEGGEKPGVGPSPGFKNLRWLKPVFAGETIRFFSEPLSARALNSRPGWGIVESANGAETLDGKPVMTFQSAVLVKI